MCRQASFFDLDHTLCQVNTSFQFGLYLLRFGLFPVYKIPYFLVIYSLCKSGLISLGFLHRTVCRSLFSGKDVFVIKKHVDRFLDEKLHQMLNPKILNFFERAKENHHYTLLLSNSPDFVVEAIAVRLGFHEWLGTRYSLSGNEFDGNVLKLVEGQDKAVFVKDFIKKMTVSLAECFAYSDSYLDLSFLESVGNPCAVNPDRRLKHVAKERNWQII